MKDTEALRLIEQKLIPAKAIASCDAAFARYAEEVLPLKFVEDRDEPLIQQGFEAGFAEAMSQARQILAEVQTIALRDTP